jgi:hypothetical protein
MEEPPPVKQLFDIRVKELNAMKKNAAISRWRELHPNLI